MLAKFWNWGINSPVLAKSPMLSLSLKQSCLSTPAVSIMVAVQQEMNLGHDFLFALLLQDGEDVEFEAPCVCREIDQLWPLTNGNALLNKHTQKAIVETEPTLKNTWERKWNSLHTILFDIISLRPVELSWVLSVYNSRKMGHLLRCTEHTCQNKE